MMLAGLPVHDDAVDRLARPARADDLADLLERAVDGQPHGSQS